VHTRRPENTVQHTSQNRLSNGYMAELDEQGHPYSMNHSNLRSRDEVRNGLSHGSASDDRSSTEDDGAQKYQNRRGPLRRYYELTCSIGSNCH
jgi:hypothetical protein